MVAPPPSTYGIWGLIALTCLTITVVWIILIVKVTSWSVTLGNNSVIKPQKMLFCSFAWVKPGANVSCEFRL